MVRSKLFQIKLQTLSTSPPQKKRAWIQGLQICFGWNPRLKGIESNSMVGQPIWPDLIWSRQNWLAGGFYPLQSRIHSKYKPEVCTFTIKESFSKGLQFNLNKILLAYSVKFHTFFCINKHLENFLTLGQ